MKKQHNFSVLNMILVTNFNNFSTPVLKSLLAYELGIMYRLMFFEVPQFFAPPLMQKTSNIKSNANTIYFHIQKLNKYIVFSQLTKNV